MAPFVSRTPARGRGEAPPPGPRYKAVSHKDNPSAPTLGLCFEGSPFRPAVTIVTDWDKVTCSKCQRLKKRESKK